MQDGVSNKRIGPGQARLMDFPLKCFPTNGCASPPPQSPPADTDPDDRAFARTFRAGEIWSLPCFDLYFSSSLGKFGRTFHLFGVIGYTKSCGLFFVKPLINRILSVINPYCGNGPLNRLDRNGTDQLIRPEIYSGRRFSRIAKRTGGGTATGSVLTDVFHRQGTILTENLVGAVRKSHRFMPPKCSQILDKGRFVGNKNLL